MTVGLRPSPEWSPVPEAPRQPYRLSRDPPKKWGADGFAYTKSAL